METYTYSWAPFVFHFSAKCLRVVRNAFFFLIFVYFTLGCWGKIWIYVQINLFYLHKLELFPILNSLADGLVILLEFVNTYHLFGDQSSKDIVRLSKLDPFQFRISGIFFEVLPDGVGHDPRQEVLVLDEAVVPTRERHPVDVLLGIPPVGGKFACFKLHRLGSRLRVFRARVLPSRWYVLFLV